MAPVTAQEKQGTMEDIYRLPEGSRAELIDGRIYAMAPPSRKHQRIVGELFAVIREYIRHKQGSCEVDIAPFAVAVAVAYVLSGYFGLYGSQIILFSKVRQEDIEMNAR